MAQAASYDPLSGLWRPRPLRALQYGPNSVKQHLVYLLPQAHSKAFIITGSSLATKTPLVKQVEALLGPERHAGTFSKIGQHAPVADLDVATDLVLKDPAIDTVISLGGGSPIDSAKAISLRVHEKRASSSSGGAEGERKEGKTSKDGFLFHIAIPTTLSAAECTQLAGYTQADGVKITVNSEHIAVDAIIYDPTFAAYTPTRLWLATGVRALDHAIETLYQPHSTEITRMITIQAAKQLFALLPAAKVHADAQAANQTPGTNPPSADPAHYDVATRLFLAAYASVGFLGLNVQGGLGLSHSLGYALGSPYGIPHGETSCMTLGRVVRLKAKMNRADAEQIARFLPEISPSSSASVTQTSPDPVRDACKVGDNVSALVKTLGLDQGLESRGVSRDEIDIITRRATGGQTGGELYDAVRNLVIELYY